MESTASCMSELSELQAIPFQDVFQEEKCQDHCDKYLSHVSWTRYTLRTHTALRHDRKIPEAEHFWVAELNAPLCL